MNEVSIIINGVRYDAVYGIGCLNCDLYEYCNSEHEPCNLLSHEMFFNKIFKKSDKKVEI